MRNLRQARARRRNLTRADCYYRFRQFLHFDPQFVYASIIPNPLLSVCPLRAANPPHGFGKTGQTCFPNFAFLGTITLDLVGQLAQGGAEARPRLHPRA